MAENSGFFASVGGDRKYNMDFLARWVASFIGNGVYDGELAVTAGDGMTVTLPAGRAWINGYHYRNDGPLTLPVDNADGVLHRKDTVVLRWDVNARSITAQVIKGAPASDAIAPGITRTVEQYDLKIAEISIPAGTTAISQSLITDTRLDNDVCGIVTGVVDQADTTTLYAQIQDDLARFRSTNEADFTAWVAGLKDVLDDETAGNLLNLITEHKADTNNPHQTTPEQIGAVKGNTASWVATEAVINQSHPDISIRLTIPNFVFSEGCQVTFLAPSTVAGPYALIEINPGSGCDYALRTLSHEALAGDEWVVNTLVTVVLSSIKIKVSYDDTAREGTAFFKSGSGSLKEMFTFPLSIQTAEPTPVDTNHIWIKNDTKMPFAIDEAIRAVDWNNNDHYYGIVDSTDNNYMHFDSPKKLTDGTAIMMSNNKNNKDAVPWNLGAGAFGKKYGVSYYAGCQNKWPRIYSRINGTIDMEDAYRWNGSAWYPLSQKGSYLFGYCGSGCRLFNNAGGVLSLHSDILDMNTGIRDAEFSRDGQFLCIIKSTSTDSDMIHLFSRTGDSFNEVSIPYNITGYKYWVCFTPDSQYMLVGGNSTTYSEIFKRNGNGFSFLKTFNNAGIPTNITISHIDDDNSFRESDIGFTSDGKFFIFRSQDYVRIYNWSNESFSLKQNIFGVFDTYQHLCNLQICEDADMFMTTPHRSNDSDESAKWGVAIYKSVNSGNFNRITNYEFYRDNDAGTEYHSFAISPSGKYYATSRYSNGYASPGFGLTIYQRQPDNTYKNIQNIFNGAYLVFTKFMSDNYFFTTSGGKDVHVFKFDGSQFVQTTYFDQSESIYRLTSLNFN